MACKYSRFSLVVRKEERLVYAQITKKVALPGWNTGSRSQISLVLFHLCLVSSTCISLSAITLLPTRVNVPCSFSRICVSSLIGSSSNDDGDGNENGKKAIGLFSKRQLCTCITRFCTSLGVSARLRLESA